jgi:Ca-activated chloride channel family protein
VLLVTALARPQHVGEQVQLPVTGRDLLLAVDISPSMDEQDMVVQGRSINRLQAVKRVLHDFIERREGDRLGLLLFGTEPYIQAPLTFDRRTVRTLLDESGIGMAGRATAIGDAIGLAVKRLRNRPQEQRVVILLTDGANTAGEIPPDKAAEIAKAAGVRIYTIGIGAESMVQRGLLGSRRINPSRDLDEGLLTRMAQQTGGQYFRARSLPELELIYESINQLEPIELEGKRYRPVNELYAWPAGLAVLIWLALQLGRALMLARATGTHHRESNESDHG